MNRLQPLTVLREDVGHVAERSWGVRWSRSGVALWHRRESFGFTPVNARREGGRSGWVAAGVVGIASIAVTAAGVVAGPVGSRPAAAPLVSIRIPPAEPLARATPSSEIAQPAIVKAVPRPAASVIVADVLPPTPLTEQPEEDAPGPAPITARAEAVAAALKAGRMRSWVDAEAGVQGFVVVGAAQTRGDRTCRDVSILIKVDGGSKVEREQRCVDG